MTIAALCFGPTPIAEALAMFGDFEESNSRATEAFLLRGKGGLLGQLGEFDQGRELIVRSGEMELELGRLAEADGARGFFLGPLEMSAGNYDAAERAMLPAYERMAASGDTGFSSSVAGNLAALYIAAGRWDEAERFTQITLETAQSDDVEAQGQGLSALGRVQAARGEFAEAEANARRAVAIADSTDFLDSRGRAYAALAEVLLAAGRRQEATEAFSRAVENYDARGGIALAAPLRKRLAEIEG